MKKIKLLFLSLLLSGMVIAQPVSSTAVIPIGVTLNSILRLNVVSGGNIEFVVTTIDHYTKGIANSPIYDTRFTVASSVDFDVRMYAETAGLFPQGDASATPMPLNNIGYVIEPTSGATGAHGTNWNLINASAITALNETSTTDIVTSLPANGAGGTTQNDFTINWELATDGIGYDMKTNLTGYSGTLLSQSLASDRYVVNVFLVLESH